MDTKMTCGDELAKPVLGTTLHELFNQEEVTRILGQAEPQDDAFWKMQRNTVTQRFLSYLLFKLDMPLTLDRPGMALNESARLQALARAYLADGLAYEKVRNWWLTQGKILHARAFALKHEQEMLASRCLRVLCFFENKRPLWLNYDADGTPTLHETREAAFEFLVNSSTELLPQSCQHLADEFKVMCKLIGATTVKVLPGPKAAAPQELESPKEEATP
jgi:hypothetical protein